MPVLRRSVKTILMNPHNLSANALGIHLGRVHPSRLGDTET